MQYKLGVKFLCKTMIVLFYLVTVAGFVVIFQNAFNEESLSQIIENRIIFKKIVQKHILRFIEQPITYLGIINAIVTGTMALSSKYQLGHCLGDIIKKYYHFSLFHVVYFYIVLAFESFCIKEGIFAVSLILFVALIIEFSLFAFTFYCCVFKDDNVNSTIKLDLCLSIMKYVYVIKVLPQVFSISNKKTVKGFVCCSDILNQDSFWDPKESKFSKFIKTKYIQYEITNHIFDCIKIGNATSASKKEYEQLKRKMLNYTSYAFEKYKSGEQNNLNLVCDCFGFLKLLNFEDSNDKDVKNKVFLIIYELLVLLFKDDVVNTNQAVIKTGQFIMDLLDGIEDISDDEIVNSVNTALSILLFVRFDAETALHIIYSSYNKGDKRIHTIMLNYLYIHIICATNNCFTYSEKQFFELRHKYIWESYDIRNTIRDIAFNEKEKIEFNNKLLNTKLKVISFFKLREEYFFSTCLTPMNIAFLKCLYAYTDDFNRVSNGPMDEIINYYYLFLF